MPALTELFAAFVSFMPAWAGVIFILFFALMGVLLILKIIMFFLQLKFW